MIRNGYVGGVLFMATAGLSGCAPAADIDFVQPEGPLEQVRDVRECAPVVERQVDALGLAGRVESITYVRDRLRERRGSDGDDIDILRGVVAWVDVSDCSGYVVIDMRPTCRIKQIYTRGECTLP